MILIGIPPINPIIEFKGFSKSNSSKTDNSIETKNTNGLFDEIFQNAITKEKEKWQS